MNKTATTLFLADDHPIFLEGLQMLLAPTKRFNIVGTATNGSDALAGLLSLKPDIAILDIAMPGLSGIAVAKELRRLKMKTKVILLTSLDDGKCLDEMMKLEVGGYVLKDNTLSELFDAIAYVLNGETYISPLVSARILKNAKTAKAHDIARLTAAEKRVLSLLAENRTSQEIASILHCSQKTVQNHRHNICGKLNLTGHNALLMFALKHRDYLN